MPSFQFVARDAKGQLQRGSRAAASPAAVASSLRELGWAVIDVRVGAAESPSVLDQLSVLNPFLYLSPRSSDIELSLNQIAVMLRGGLTLLATLRNVAEQAQRPSMRRVWLEVADSIQEGSDLADAMAKHSCFSKLIVQLVRVGEQTGILEQVIVRGADGLEKKRALISTLFTALAYPTIVLLAAIGVTVFMIVSVIPKLQFFLTSLGRRLPAMTQLLLDISTAVHTYWLPFLVGLMALTGAAFALYSWPPARYHIDRYALRVPILGRIFRLAATAMFSRNLGILIRSGITLLEGLRTVEQLHRNRYHRERIVAARDSVMQGKPLADPLQTPYAFMPMLAAMVAVGETAGTLDEVLDEVARFHESQLQIAVRRLSILVEPMIVVVVGGIVGFVYISFFLAMFATASPIK